MSSADPASPLPSTLFEGLFTLAAIPPWKLLISTLLGKAICKDSLKTLILTSSVGAAGSRMIRANIGTFRQIRGRIPSKTNVIHCIFSGSDVGSKWRLLYSLLNPKQNTSIANLRHLVFPCTEFYTQWRLDCLPLLTLCSIGMASSLALIPSKGFTLRVSASKGWRVQRPNKLVLEVPFCVIIPCQHGGAIIMQKNLRKGSWEPRSVHQLYLRNLHSEEPFEWLGLSTSVWNDPSLALSLLLSSLKCPSEGVRSCLERTVSSLSSLRRV